MDHAQTDVKAKAIVHGATLRSESELFTVLEQTPGLDDTNWTEIAKHAERLIDEIRAQKKQPLIDQFLNEYSLSSEGGAQLMRLAEALSRTIDPVTADELIRDKLMKHNWLSHASAGHNIPMRLMARALHLSDRWLRWSSRAKRAPSRAIAKIGDAILRHATQTAIRNLSSQFVFAENLDAALKRAKKYGRDGYLFSFDMLGEAARTQKAAQDYYRAYSEALEKVAADASSNDPRENHGISVKLSALHPRYEYAQAAEVVPEIVALLKPLAVKAKSANVQITIDAEEAERLDISMDVLSGLVRLPELSGWQGLGFVVQAYQRRALPLLDWLMTQSKQLGAPLMIRLVKGAYWDSEIKQAQEMGLDSYPVYTRKEMTDLSYLACAKKLLAHPECFSPQFATHNAVSIAAIQKTAPSDNPIEFQRLFGMGQQLHDNILHKSAVTSRIYAPVGTQKDLLSYLIRRLLENGANGAFVNKLADPQVEAAVLIHNPIKTLKSYPQIENPKICTPRGFLNSERMTAEGYDLSNPVEQQKFKQGLDKAEQKSYSALPIIDGKEISGEKIDICNPANPTEVVGQCSHAKTERVETVFAIAGQAFPVWSAKPTGERAMVLEKAADLLEERASVFHYLAIKEAGKSWQDAIDEVREAVDFCRYYAARAMDDNFQNREGLGVAICISPWNFPLAIFLGQVTAALAAGNIVIAKPAEQTPLIAAEAIRLLHDAGVDKAAVNLMPGSGADIGEALVSHPDTAAICFTGSTTTAKHIASKLAALGKSQTPLIAETGGINAMIVDSSALLEQTLDDVISSAFQSAGQRCSALRLLCLQSDIADEFIELLSGAMDALHVGDPIALHTDIGPVIDLRAKENIADHIAQLERTARKVGKASTTGKANALHAPPVAYEIDDFTDLTREIFGPVLHIIRFDANQKMEIIKNINNSGYGLTLGIQSRIDNVGQEISERADVGNIYINRNQIGAVVGVQPFGGHGLSGTGPKAGGPLYLYRLSKAENTVSTGTFKPSIDSPFIKATTSKDLMNCIRKGKNAQRLLQSLMAQAGTIENSLCFADPVIGNLLKTEMADKQKCLGTQGLLNSTVGETNHYSVVGRGLIISILEDEIDIIVACLRSLVTGNAFLQISEGQVCDKRNQMAMQTDQACGIEDLIQSVCVASFDEIYGLVAHGELDAIIASPSQSNLDNIGTILAQRTGPILPILSPTDTADRYVHEKLVTNNIAAAGGDFSLLTA